MSTAVQKQVSSPVFYKILCGTRISGGRVSFRPFRSADKFIAVCAVTICRIQDIESESSKNEYLHRLSGVSK